jgi:hypothetical protein
VSLRGPLRKRESHLWERDPNDWYVEPEWCSERLFAMAREWGWGLFSVWDPAAGCGRIVRSALAANIVAQGTDIDPKDPAVQRYDFFKYDRSVVLTIVSNPPFSRAEEFARHALACSDNRVVLLLPANWVQGDKRSRWLETTPLRRVLFLTPRPSMPPGSVVVSGGKPGNGTTDYAWFIWEHGYGEKAEIGWCRRC